MLTIDLNAPAGLTEQIRQGIRRALASGTLTAGQPLPPVRQLAADLGINFNTVARAYRALEDEGLVHTARGRGTRVLASRQIPPAPRWHDLWQEKLTQLAADAKLAGMTQSQFKRACTAAGKANWSMKSVRTESV